MKYTEYTCIYGIPGQIRQFLEDLPCTVDKLVFAAQDALDLWPDRLFIHIRLFDTVRQLRQAYREKYQQDCDYRMFTSLGSSTVYLAVSDFNMHMVAHEFGHVIVESYFTERPPYKLHELLAQFCATNIRL